MHSGIRENVRLAQLSSSYAAGLRDNDYTTHWNLRIDFVQPDST